MWGVLVGLVLLWSSGAAVVVSCRDETNRDVDWYILYKAPNSNPPTSPKYIYIGPNVKRVLTSINDPNGVLANTLRPMFNNNQPPSFGFLSYNDQPPNKAAGDTYVQNDTYGQGSTYVQGDKNGHSKGVVLGDSETQTALWLTHSTPKFPFERNVEKFYPDSGHRNGQTFMCVTLPFSELSKVGKHLQYIRAYPIELRISSSFPKEMIDAANQASADPPGSFVTLITRGRKELKIRAKKMGSKASDGDLYVQLAEDLFSDMNVQTWGCQSGRDKSFCEKNKYKVMNVQTIHTDLGKWSTTRDHSKWAVTTANNIVWTCIADMNRAPSQYERRGGALCIEDKSVNGFFKGFVDSNLPCQESPAPCSSEILDVVNNSFDVVNNSLMWLLTVLMWLITV